MRGSSIVSMPIRARCIGLMIPLAVFGARLWWLTGRFSWVTKTEISWSWIMARTNPRSNWLAWGAPVYSSPVCKRNAVHRDPDAPVRHRQVTMRGSESSAGRNLVWLLFVLMFLGHQDFWWWDDAPSFWISSNRLGLPCAFSIGSPCLVGSPLARHGPVN